MQRLSSQCCNISGEDIERFIRGKPSAAMRTAFAVWYDDRIQNLRHSRTGSVAAAAAAVAAADAGSQRLKRAVLAHAVYERGKDRPAASFEHARREYVSACSENEQDDENPETVVAAKTAIHSFSSYQHFRNALAGDGRRYVLVDISAVYVTYYEILHVFVLL